MNHLAISCSIIFITSISSCVFLLWHKPRTPLKYLWAAATFAVSAWSFCLLRMSLATNPIDALAWGRANNHAAIFIPFIFFHFILTLTHQIQEKKKELVGLYFFGITYNVLAWTFPHAFIPTVSPFLSFEFYPDAGPLYYPFPIFYSLVFGYALYLLYQKYQTATATEKNQFKYIFLGVGIGCMGGGTTFFGVFDIPVYPYGNYLTPVYILLMVYAVAKYQLMDIRLVIQKSVLYSLLLTMITVFYLLAIVASERIFKNVIGYRDTTATIIITILIAIAFNPLKNKLQNFLDKTFFRGTAAEIAAQNERLRQEIAQSERYKTLVNLTSNIIDEIKNPLTALKGYGHFLEQKKGDEQFMEKYMKVQKNEVERINELLQRLTEYSNPTTLSLQMTVMSKLITETLGFLKGNLTEHKIELVKEMKAPEGVQLLVDPSQLRQAISNIVLNAAEAMPDGGTLKISTEMDEEFYRICISDTGCGIPKEIQPKIFDPFFTKKEGHSGLGLSITQGVIENHKGKLRMKSDGHKGAEFIIELPARKS